MAYVILFRFVRAEFHLVGSAIFSFQLNYLLSTHFLFSLNGVWLSLNLVWPFLSCSFLICIFVWVFVWFSKSYFIIWMLLFYFDIFGWICVMVLATDKCGFLFVFRGTQTHSQEGYNSICKRYKEKNSKFCVSSLDRLLICHSGFLLYTQTALIDIIFCCYWIFSYLFLLNYIHVFFSLLSEI